MSKVKNTNYISIQGWMVTDLHLKGNDLLIYAIIYGFTQDGEQWFEGSRQYLAEWCNSTTRGVSKNLNSLVEKGYLIKEDVLINNVKFCKYKANINCSLVGNKVHMGEEQSSPPPREQSSPNNLDNNKNNNINYTYTTRARAREESKCNVCPVKKEKEEFSLQNKHRNQTYEDITTMYNATCKSLSKVSMLSIKRKKQIDKMFSLGYSLEDFKKVFENTEKSSFLCGKSSNKNNWRANFDWLIEENNFLKVLEGNYQNLVKENTKAKPKTNASTDINDWI